MAVQIQPFGISEEGKQADRIVFSDAAGNIASVISYGAALQALQIRKPDGSLTDVCLGYDTLAEYEAANSCFGATMGRCAGRIADSRFVLSGQEYRVSENRKGFHIHGGFRGFHKRLWDYEVLEDGVCLTYHASDDEEGYPGDLTARVTYRWQRSGVLELEYDCISNRETVINLTNHSYFNLNGHDSGTILEHTLQIFSGFAAETRENSLPTGRYFPVAGTPLDFTLPHTIGSRIGQDYPPLTACGGYDHNYPLEEGLHTAAILTGTDGLTMTVKTDLPDLGLYTANFLAPQPGKGGAQYGPRCGVCLESQYLPNAVNLPGVSPQPVFQAGERYHHLTQFCFTCEP